MSLSELFVQILESEQKAEERKNVLNEIKKKIGNIRAELGAVQDQQSSLRGQLILKIKTLSEEELNLKWYLIKDDILTEQLNALQVINKRRITDLSNERQKHEEEMKLFQEELANFNKGYDLQGIGIMKREGIALTEIEELKKQERQLNEEMSQYREHTRILNELTEEKEGTIMEINEMEDTRKDFDEVLQKEEEEINKLEKEKNDVANKAHSCSEFKRLQNELESCQDDALESVCAALQLELDQLQRSLWQKQLHNRSTKKHKTSNTNNARSQQHRPQSWVTGKSMTESSNKNSQASGPKQSCFKWPPSTEAPATFKKHNTTTTSELPKPNLRKLQQEMQKKNDKVQAPTFDLQLDSLLEDFEDIPQDFNNDDDPVLGHAGLKTERGNNRSCSSSSSQDRGQTNTILPTVSKKVRFR